MSLDELYRTLRELVSDKYRIEIRDGINPKIAIVPDSNYDMHPWTHFEGFNLEDSLMRAITKLSNPSMNYREKPNILDPEGYLWAGIGDSIFGEEHIKLFLKGAEEQSIINQGRRST